MDPLLEKEFDLRLQLPNHALFVGASMSGKTQLALRLLLASPDCLQPPPKTILFYYDQWQDEYESVKTTLATRGTTMVIRQGGGSLTLDELEKQPHQTLVVIDDASEETSSSADIAKIATNGRHKNISLWLIWHSLFSKHPASRVISQNVGYYFLMPSARLTSQIHSLDTQLRMRGALLSAYSRAIAQEDWQERYLLLDLATTTPAEFRLRSRVLSPEVQVVYMS